MPFVKISRTKSGKTIKDKQVARQLTAFLHAQAGLAFTTSSSVQPRHQPASVARARVLAACPRIYRRARRHHSHKLISSAVKFVRELRASVSDEMRLHAIASASGAS